MSDIKKIKLFLYTVDEYKKFADFFSVKKEHSLVEGFTEGEYVAIQTKLIILRKYGSNRDAVYLIDILNEAIDRFPEKKEDFINLQNLFSEAQNNQMETILADGRSKSLFSTIEDVMYGLFLHADENRIEDITKIDRRLLFIATRKYVEDLEKIVLKAYELLNSLVVDKYEQQQFTHVPVISVSNNRQDVQDISNSPYWTNIYGKDISDEQIQQIIEGNTEEDNHILLICYCFIKELQSNNYSVNTLHQLIFPPTKSDWGDFSKLHKMVIEEVDIGWSTQVEYNEKHDMAYVHLLRHVQGAFSIDHPHILTQDISVITLVHDNKELGWRIFKIGERAEYYKVCSSLSEVIKGS